MTLYELLKFIHIIGAIAWVGTSIEQQFVGYRAQRSGDPDRFARFVDEAEWVGLRIMTPAAIVVVFAGVAMVLESGWNFSDTWISIGIGLFILTSLNGMLYLNPQSKRLKHAIAEHGPTDERVQAQARRVGIASQIDLVILLAIVWVMVTKPGV